MTILNNHTEPGAADAEKNALASMLSFIADVQVLEGRPNGVLALDAKQLSAKLDSTVLQPSAARLTKQPTDIAPQPHTERPSGLVLTQGAEQDAVLQRLAVSPVAVVKGPAGSGKTQIAANVIAHYIANGKSVLATSSSLASLRQLSQRLPKELKNHTITYLEPGAELLNGLRKQGGVASKTKNALQPVELLNRLTSAQQKSHLIRSKLNEVEAQIEHENTLANAKVQLGNAEHTMASLARYVQDNEQEYGWMEPIEWANNKKGTIVPEVLSRASGARQILGESLGEDQPQVNSTGLAGKNDIKRLHRDLLALKNRELIVQNATVRASLGPKANTLALSELADSFDKAISILASATKARPLPPVSAKIVEIYVEPEKADLQAKLDLAMAEIHDILSERAGLFDKVFELPSLTAERKSRFWALVESLANGKNALAWWRFPGKEDVNMIDAVRINGNKPVSNADWQSMLDYNRHIKRSADFVGSWNPLAQEIGLEGIGNPLDFRGLLKNYNTCKSIRKTIEPLKRIYKDMNGEGTFIDDKSWHDPQAWVLWAEHTRNCAALLNERKAVEFKDAILSWAQTQPESLRQCIEETVVGVVGDSNWDEDHAGAEWLYCLREVNECQALHEAQKDLIAAQQMLELAGAKQWAQKIVSTPYEQEGLDVCSREHWSQAWDWSRARSLIKELKPRKHHTELCEVRKKLLAELQQINKELLDLQAWSNARMSPIKLAAEQNLDQGLAQDSLGADMIAALKPLSHAPCWVIEQHLVSQVLASDWAGFDLVIMDEASCSGVDGLLCTLRGKQVLIMGDGQEASRDTDPAQDAEKMQLWSQRATGTSLSVMLGAGSSLMDFYLSAYPQETITLKNHYKCSPEIAGFLSDEYYSGNLHLLTFNGGMQPLMPAISHVRSKKKTGHGNPLSVIARVISSELTQILLNKHFDDKKIAIITTAGSQGATELQSLITQAMGPAQGNRNITFTSSSQAHGASFDIVLLALAHDESVGEKENERHIAKHLGACVGSARQHLMVFTHDAWPLNELSAPGHLLKYIANFPQKYQHMQAPTTTLTSFETELTGALESMGYKVAPHYQVGPYTIDLVVQGKNGRRLAIACDGDKASHENNNKKESQEQETLEALCWPYWRCQEAHWIHKPHECMSDLILKLKDLGIEAH